MSEEKEEVFEEKEEREEEVFEEKEEKREERPDTLSGLIQSIIPLMIIPQILPLFQQSLGQTLRETTLNVKVESSMAIIPIDIAAQTAIVAVDIKAQSVTLNVNIASQSVTLNVNITGQDVTLNVNIASQTTTLNVNIAAAEAVVKINVSAQSVDVQLTGTFYTLTGYEKKWSICDEFTPNGGVYYPDGLIRYTVPSGKRLIVYGLGVTMFGMLLFGDQYFRSRYPTAGWYYVYYTVGDDLFVIVLKGSAEVYEMAVCYNQRHVYVELPTPLVFNAGETLTVQGITQSYMTFARVSVHAVEIPA